MRPVSIGNPEHVTANELVATVAEVSGKEIHIEHLDAPAGVYSRNFSNSHIESMGWREKYAARDGIAATYPWIEQQTPQAAVARVLQRAG